MRPFVGRSRQQAEITAALDRVGTGVGGLVFLTGEPGIGKTRLLDQVDSRATERAMRVAWGRCWEAGAAPAYFPFYTALMALWRALGDDERRALATPETAAAGQLVPPLAALVPLVQAAGGGDAAQARFLLFSGVASFLRLAARRAPVLLALDDLHDADRSSLALLAFLARDLRSMAVLIVGTFRDVEARLSPEIGAQLGRIGREGLTLPLPRLDRDESAALARALAGPVDGRITEALYQATQGNPLFLSEMLRAEMLRAGDRPGRAGVASALGEGEILPQSVREVMRQRLRLLSEDARAVLEAASALGDEFGVGEVAEAIGRAPAEVEEAMASATEAGVTAPASARRLRFSHALFREALYRDLPASRRRGLHAAILASLERRYDGDPRAPAAALAHHALEAGPEHLAAAVRHAARAAAAALDLAAYEDALQLLEHVNARVVEESTDGRVRAEALLALGQARMRAGDGAGGKEACRQALELARSVGDADLFGRAALALGAEISVGVVDSTLVASLEEALARLAPVDSPLRIGILARLAGALQPSPTPEHPIALAGEAIAAARRLGDDATLLGALHAGMAAMMDYVDPAERVPLNREIEALASRLGDRAKQLRAHARLVFDLSLLPDFAGAMAEVERYGRLADETRLPHHRWRTPLMRAMLLLAAGRVGDASTAVDDAETLARASGEAEAWRSVVMHRFAAAHVTCDGEAMRRWLPDVVAVWASAVGGADLGVVLRATVTSLAGEVEATRAHLARLGPSSQVWASDVSLLAWMSEVVALAGEKPIAARLFPRLTPHADACISVGMSGYVWMGVGARFLGLLAACLEHWDEADAYFARAQARAETIGAPTFHALTQFERARALLARGRDEDAPRARALLDTAATEADVLGLVGLRARIDSLRGGAPRSRAIHPAPAAPSWSVAIRREGEYWTIEADGVTARLRDSRGLQILATLVTSPDREIHALELASTAGDPGAGAAPTIFRGDAGELLDQDAREAYRERIAELRDTVSEAEASGDEGRRAHAARELAALTAELARAVGLGGRARRAGSAAERARVAVQRRLKDALSRFEAASPELGRQLARRIYTGTFCSYRPREPRPVR